MSWLLVGLAALGAVIIGRQMAYALARRAVLRALGEAFWIEPPTDEIQAAIQQLDRAKPGSEFFECCGALARASADALWNRAQEASQTAGPTPRLLSARPR